MKVLGDRVIREKNSHFNLNGEPKIKYNTESEAVIRCYEMNMKNGQVHKMMTYKCPVCQKWHIGNSHRVLTQDDKDKIRKKYKEVCIKLGNFWN